MHTFRVSEMTAEPATGPQPWEAWWFLSNLLPDAPVGWQHRRYRVTGPVDLHALHAAWRVVLARHRFLRTNLVERDGRPTTVVKPVPAHSSFTVTDLARADQGDATGDAERRCASAITGTADLAHDPLARLRVFRWHAAGFDILLSTHATVADVPSTDRLVTELSEAYGNPRRGSVDGSFGAGDRRTDPEWPAGDDHPDMLVARTQRLTPPPPPLDLPTDRTRPPAIPWRAATLRFDWGTTAGRVLHAGCQSEGTSPLGALAAAFLVLLGRHNGTDRVALATPADLPPPAPNERIGPFTNLLLLAGDLSGEPTFREVLRRTDREVADALRCRGVPLRHVVRELTVDLDRDPHRLPLTDAVLVLRGLPEAELRLTGATVQREPVPEAATVADLVLTVDRVEPTLTGSLTYRADLFESATAVGLLGQLRTLLLAGFGAPATPVDALPLDPSPIDVPGPELTTVSAHIAGGRTGSAESKADAGRTGVPPAEAVLATVHRHGTTWAEQRAVVGPDDALTYRQLSAEAAAVAARLTADGGVVGTPVAVRMTPGPRQIAASLGAWRAGAHLTWLGTGPADERSRMVLAALRPSRLLLDRSPVDDDLACWYRDELGGTAEDISTTTSDTPEGTTTSIAPADTTDEDASVLGLAAYTAFTSGSTGRPKGVTQTHAALTQFVTWFSDTFDLRRGSRVAQWVTPEHDPSLCEVFATLLGGGTVYSVPARIRTHPEKLVDWLAAEQITFLQTVPSFARELVKAITARSGPTGAGPSGLPELRWLVLMGEAVSGELVNDIRIVLPTTRLANVYGPTETIAATWHEIVEPADGVVPIGQPIPGREVLVLDDHDRPCPTGVTGQLVVASPYVAAGYLNPEDNGSAFAPVPALTPDDTAALRWYRTGDLGRRRWDGALEFRGRRDLQVKLYGNRLELTDVEAALAGHSSVTECAVLPITGADGLVTELVAFVVPRGTAGSAAEWRAHLRRRFGPALAQVSIVPMREPLPRNVGGKVDRRRLPTPRRGLRQSERGPSGDVEEALAGIWATLLGTPPRDVRDDFFARGGHSLQLPVLAALVRHQFGRNVSLADLYANPSLAGMAGLVDAARTSGRDHNSRPHGTRE